MVARRRVTISTKKKPTAVRTRVRKRTTRKVARSPSNAYAALLQNPCTGPLVHGPGSSEGGQVVRFESDFLYGTGATDTAGFLNWTPGALCSAPGANQFGNGCAAGVGVSDTASLTAANLSYTSIPGADFLRTNASSYRCLAACAQVYWPGSELNRQGLVSAAQGTYGLVPLGAGSIVSGLRSISPVVERMPTDFMEVKWAPNYADGLFRNPSSTGAPEDGHSSILLTFAGIPVSTGVRIRFVAVYEWRPRVTGLVLSSNTSMHESAISIQEIRSMLDRADANWWNKTGQAAMKFLQGSIVAYAARRATSYPRLEL